MGKKVPHPTVIFLVLIPLAGAAFLGVSRHPVVGVAAALRVNMLIRPLDAVLTEFTNDAIHLVNPPVSIDPTAKLWFSIASVIVLTFVITFITRRGIEPRLGKCSPADASDLTGTPDSVEDSGLGDEPRGLEFAAFGLPGVDPESVRAGERVADSPVDVITPQETPTRLLPGLTRTLRCHFG
ncbi:MAG: AbgT family transporter [Verrucomicrobia bacterium]|nr:AbgT family transporter [Verrucomicrobiota bacterium]